MNSIALAVINDQVCYVKGSRLVRSYMENPEFPTSYFIREMFHICSYYYKYSKACAGEREKKHSLEYLEEAAAEVAEYWVNHWVENQCD